MSRESQSALLPTILGIVAIILWGTMIPLSRHAAEQLGTFSSAATVYLASGGIGCLYLLATARSRGPRPPLPRKYLFGCGGLMMAYTILLYAAIGFARDRQELITVTVANYLWPGLTLVLSISLLGNKARGGLFAVAILVSTAGVWLAMSSGGEGRASGLSLPVLAALAAAVAWGLYSNLSRRWAAGAEATAMPWFLLATGLCLLALRFAVAEENTWSWRAGLEVAYLAVFPTLSAYTFWDLAMRRGNLVLVAAVSYLTPILSVWVSNLYLGVPVAPVQWLASGMVVLGAAGCRWAIREA